MNNNKQAYKLEQIAENLDLACEFMEMLIRSGAWKNPEYKLDQHVGMIALLEAGAHDLDKVAKANGVDIGYTPVDKSTLDKAVKFQERMERFVK